MSVLSRAKGEMAERPVRLPIQCLLRVISWIVLTRLKHDPRNHTNPHQKASVFGCSFTTLFPEPQDETYLLKLNCLCHGRRAEPVYF